MGPFPEHVIVMPEVGLGHIIPMLAMAKRLSASFRISFIVSDFDADLICRRGMLTPPPKAHPGKPPSAVPFSTNPANFRLIPLESTMTEVFDLSKDISAMISYVATIEAGLPRRLAAANAHYAWDDAARAAYGTAAENEPSLERFHDFWPQRPTAVLVDTMVLSTFLTSRGSMLRGVPIATFQTTSASAYAFFLKIFQNYDQSKHVESDLLTTFSTKSSRQIYAEMQHSAEGLDDAPTNLESISPLVQAMLVKNLNVLPQASVMLLDTLYDLEPGVVDALNAERGDRPPIQCAGPLCCYEMFVEPKPDASLRSQSHRTVVDWLDQQATGSVVYVSFGSMAHLDEAQVLELERALLESGRPCLWALRRAAQQVFLSADTRAQRAADEDDHICVAGRALVVDWCPQRDVLAHRALGGFVSHCGWNGAQESLSAGVPVLAWPMFAEQHANAALLTRLGVAEALPNTRQFGRIVPADEIRAAIHRLVDPPQGDSGPWTTPKERAEAMSRAAIAAVGEGGSSRKHWEAFPSVPS